MKILSFLLVIILTSGLCEGLRILALMPLNSKSHFIISEQLFKGLAKKGHQVDVISHFPLKKPFPNYNDISLHGTLPDVTNNVTYEFLKHFNGFSMRYFTQRTGDSLCQLLGHPILQNIIKNPPKDPPYDMVITELFASNCYLSFGRLLNVPVVGLITAAWLDWLTVPLGNPFNPAVMPLTYLKMSQPMSFLERLENTLSFLLVHVQFHYYMQNQLEYVHKYIGKDITNIYDLYQDISLVLVNSHYSLNGIRPFTPGIVEIGGLHVADEKEPLPSEVQKWLDDSKNGCVYVSFGSMIRLETFPKETLDVFYKTFENLASIRFLLKIAKKEDLPPGLPKNVMIYHWLPQIQVLKHKNIRAFITHGGLMGTLESIVYGVPMVGLPLFGDQFINMKHYDNKKIAITLNYKQLTQKSFTEAINTILTNPEYRKNIDRISKIYFNRPMNPMETAIFWIEYISKHGNILQSPAILLPWWKIALLDIYAFIIFSLLIVYYIFRWIIKRIYILCYSKNRDKNVKLTSKKTK